jgi:Na+/H+-dicarboxylate symporter
VSETGREHRLTAFVLVALVLGAAVGEWIYRGLAPGAAPPSFLGDLGELVLIRPLVAVSIPLVFLSVIVGVTGVGEPKNLGKLGAATLAFYLTSMLLAATVGATLVATFRPGEGLDPAIVENLKAGGEGEFAADASRKARMDEGAGLGAWGAAMSILRQAVPRNVLSEAAAGNTLGVIVTAIILGAALLAIGDRGRAVVGLLESLLAALMRIVGWILVLLPLGVFLVTTATVAKAGLASLGGPLAGYMLVVLAGLAIQMLAVLPLMQLLCGGGHPYRYLLAMRRPILTALGTSSSNATLPVTIDACVRDGGCSRSATGFAVPLGATVNMDGTALYEAVAVIFLCQLFGIDLTVGEMALVAIVATVAAIGAAGIPSAGLVTMVLVVTAVNGLLAARGQETLPVAAIGVIIGVDRVLDMCRTAVNVYGDCVAAKVVTRLSPD